MAKRYSLASQCDIPSLRETRWSEWLCFLLFTQEMLCDPENRIHICPEFFAVVGHVTECIEKEVFGREKRDVCL